MALINIWQWRLAIELGMWRSANAISFWSHPDITLVSPWISPWISPWYHSRFLGASAAAKPLTDVGCPFRTWFLASRQPQRTSRADGSPSRRQMGHRQTRLAASLTAFSRPLPAVSYPAFYPALTSPIHILTRLSFRNRPISTIYCQPLRYLFIYLFLYLYIIEISE